MLKLTRALFLADPNAEYADYYERSLYNGILASQDPDSGMVTYFQVEGDYLTLGALSEDFKEANMAAGQKRAPEYKGY